MAVPKLLWYLLYMFSVGEQGEGALVGLTSWLELGGTMELGVTTPY